MLAGYQFESAIARRSVLLHSRAGRLLGDFLSRLDVDQGGGGLHGASEPAGPLMMARSFRFVGVAGSDFGAGEAALNTSLA